MASKLKDLKITKVDFVDAGANQQADVLLFKHKDGAPEAPKAEPEHQSVLKRIIASIMSVAKREGIEQTEIEEIMKGCDAETFDEKYKSAQLRKTTDEIWDFCYFLQDSLCSIVRDNDVAVAEKGTMMNQSLAEFTEAVTAAISLWANAQQPERRRHGVGRRRSSCTIDLKTSGKTSPSRRRPRRQTAEVAP